MAMPEISPVQCPSVSWCMNCVGWHPDQLPTIIDAFKKMTNAHKDAWKQQQTFEGKRLNVYANKSCALCGRTYNSDGTLDETWKETAYRVKQEFDHAGIFGVSDKDIELIVAKCRKAVRFLFKNRIYLISMATEKFNAGNEDAFLGVQKWTFSGHLALILTHAIEARKSKMGWVPAHFKGPVS